VFDAELIHRRQLLYNSAATIAPILMLVASLPLFVEEPPHDVIVQRNWEYIPSSIAEYEPDDVITCVMGGAQLIFLSLSPYEFV
jgi:hypothetical protein